MNGYCRSHTRVALSLIFLIVLTACGRDAPTTEQTIEPNELAFPGLRGPAQATAVPTTPPRTPLSDYTDGSVDALGLLVLDESSSWLGLVHGLKSVGLPVRVVMDIEQALQHDVLMIYPMLTGSNVTPDTLRQLAGHVRSGKTLVAFSVIGGGMPALFGFEATVEHRGRRAIQFTESNLAESFIFEPEESVTRLSPLSSDNTSTDASMPGVSFTATRREPIAVYADGSAAITQNFFAVEDGSTGYAYALGLDLGHFILRAHNGRLSGYADEYVNAYQPSVDSFLRLLLEIYRQGEPDAVLLSPVPEGKDLTVLLTHDVDFTQSLINTLAYAESEQEAGVPATYFIQSKYIRDYNDDLFFDSASLPLLESLVQLGAEIASHTVAHSNEFRYMPIGTGFEQYPDYQPFVQSFDAVRGASVLGELRVSKFLLEHSSNSQVRAFRPGHLSLPDNLPELLSASDYDFSSSITANEALTHLPFRLMHSRGYDAEVDVYEFPVTFEDEQWALEDSLPDVLAVTEKIARHGGVVNIMIHTELTGEKLTFQERFIEAIRDQSYFGTLNDFGDWWVARDSIALEVVERSARERQLRITPEQAITGLTLDLPAHWEYAGGLQGSRQVGNRLILGPLLNSVVLNFSLREN